MKNIFLWLLLISLSQTAVFKVAAAQDSQGGVGQAFTAVQQSIGNLITAKDQNNDNNLDLRIETFRKVINLSISETKDLKVRLLTTDNGSNKEVAAWQDKMAAALNKVLNYYNQQGQNLDQITNLDLVIIKNLASDFKTWRDENYLPIADQINSFVLIQEEKNAISVAEKRAQKISSDIQKLPKIKSFDPASMLNNAKNSISRSKELNSQAYDLFLNQFIEMATATIPDTTLKPNTVSATTSSLDTTVLAPVTLNPDNSSTTKDNSSALVSSTSTGQNTTSTEVSPPSPPSIKDLIKASLNKIKDAYQIFIEMSNSVRKLLS